MYPVISRSMFSNRFSCCGDVLPLSVHMRISFANRPSILDFVMSSFRCSLYCFNRAGVVETRVRCWGIVKSLLWDCSDFWQRSITRQRWSPGRLSSHDSMLADMVASRKKYVPSMWSILCLPVLNVGGAVVCVVLGSWRSNRLQSFIKSCISRSAIGVLKSPITKISKSLAIFSCISAFRSIRNCFRGFGSSIPLDRSILHCCAADVVGPAEIAEV